MTPKVNIDFCSPFSVLLKTLESIKLIKMDVDSATSRAVQSQQKRAGVGFLACLYLC